MSPSNSGEQQPTYTDSIIAFMDVLGPKSHLKDAASAHNPLCEVSGVFGTLHGRVHEIRHGRMAYEGGAVDVRVSAFSDHLAISSLSSKYGARAVILEAISTFDSCLLLNKRLMRGAIVRGPLYHEGGVIFGQGLVDAAMAEANGFLPRLVISPGVIATAHGAEKPSEVDPSLRAQWLRRNAIRKEGEWFAYNPLERDPEYMKREALCTIRDDLLRSERGSEYAKGRYLEQLLGETG